MKKDFKIDKETEMMIKAVNENHIKQVKQDEINRKKKEEEKNKKDQIYTIITIAVIILIILTIILERMNEEDMKRCIKKGYDYDYCEVQTSR